MLRITDVDYLGDYTLALTFNNDEKRVCDLKPYLSGEVFGELRDCELAGSLIFTDENRTCTVNGINASLYNTGSLVRLSNGRTEQISHLNFSTTSGRLSKLSICRLWRTLTQTM